MLTMAKTASGLLFADDAEDPHVLIVGTNWAYLVGNAAYDGSDGDLRDHILAQHARLPTGEQMLLHLCSPGWEAKLESLLGSKCGITMTSTREILWAGGSLALP